MKHDSSQRNVALPTPLVRKFVTPKVSDYSNKLRLGLGRCHLEQRTYCLNVNWQIRVGTMGHFLIREQRLFDRLTMARIQILVHSCDPEQGGRRWFADGLNQRFSLVCGAG